MTTKLFRLVSILLCMSFIFLSTAEDAKAEIIDLGEFCVGLDITGTSLAPNKLKLSVSSLDNQNFRLNGTYRLADGTLLAPVHGTAVLEGNEVVATLTGTLISAQSPPTGTIFYLHLILSRSQLLGSGNEMIVELIGPNAGTHLVSGRFTAQATPCD